MPQYCPLYNGDGYTPNLQCVVRIKFVLYGKVFKTVTYTQEAFIIIGGDGGGPKLWWKVLLN